MTKAAKERMWLLNRWWGPNGASCGCWGPMRGFEGGVKKWEAHKAWLVKNGYLEQSTECNWNFRITPAGRAALEAEQ